MITPVITHYSTQPFLEAFQTHTKTFPTLTLTKKALLEISKDN